MQPRLQATLADFVPALRFVAPELVAEYLEHENLPAAWWMSVPVVRAANTFGRDELPGRLADLAYTELRHLRLGDLLPGAWLASNGFRLSQWPDGARTNVMVRTPDWADLLTTTVREVGDWTQIGTSTVRPLVARLFEEVLGLLPGDDESMDAVPGLSPFVADEPVAAAPTEADPVDVAAPAAPVPEPAPEVEPEPEPEPEPDAGPATDDVDAMLEDWRDLDEDELRPVEAPVPLTDELGVVVRWLAQQAPDVPLMAQLAQVTLETAAVVGLEEASPQVRTALTALLSQVPSGLRSSLVLPPAPRADELPDAEPAAEAEPMDAFGETPPATQASVPAGLDAYGEIPPTTQAAVPVPLPPEPPTAPEPRSERDPKLRTTDDTSDAPAVRAESRAEPAAKGRDRVSHEPPTEAEHAGLDAYGEVPPGTVADLPLRTVRGGAKRAESAAGTPAPKSEVPARGDEADADEAGLDAFGEVPPPTAGELPAVAAEPPAARSDAGRTPAGEPEPARTPEGLPIPPRPSHPPRAAAAAAKADVPSVPAPPDHSAVPRTNRGTKAASADPEATVEMVPGTLPAPPDDVTMLVDRPRSRAGEPGGGDLAAVLSSWFTDDAEPRRKVLARDRLFTDAPRELESLAAEFGTSPAEVKIMERDLRRNLEERISRSDGAPVRVHLSFVRDRVGALTTVSELRALHPKHTSVVAGLDIQVWQVLRGLLDLHTSVDGWLSSAPIGELADRTSATLDAACARGPVPLKALERDLAAMGIRKPLQSAWIARLEGFQVDNGHVLSRSADTLERPAQRGSAGPAPIGDPSWTAGCFHEDTHAWSFRVDVSTAMLEGEPVKVPPAFAQALGLTQGGQVRLHHGHGPAALRWAQSPYFVSLRAILAGLSAHDGDMVFVSSIHQGRLEARLVRGDATVRLPRWARALRHTGVDPVPEQVNLPELLAARIGLEAGSDLKAVLHRLHQRGDTDVLELLGVTQPR